MFLGLKGINVLKFVPLYIYITCLFLLPFFYNQRLGTKIFKTDFYLIWIVGSICWMHILLKYSLSIYRLGRIVLIGVLYILLLCFINSTLDENSIHAFITMVCCLGIIYYLRIIINSSNNLAIIVVLLLPYFIQVFIGYIQANENNWENLSIKGQLYNSGFFGNYLASMLPLLFGGFASKIRFSIYSRIGFLIAFFSVLMLLFFTGARAAYIGSTIGCLFVLFSQAKNIKNKSPKILFITSAIILCVMVTALYQLKPASAKGRLTIYKISLNIIKDHPFIGIGPNRFAVVYNNYQSEYFKKEQASLQVQLLAGNILEAFNSLLQIVVEYGIIGCIIFFIIVYRIMELQNSYPKNLNNKWLRTGSLGCIITIFVCSLFSNPFHLTPILLIFPYHLSIILPIQEKNAVNILQKKPLQVVACISFLAFVCYYIILYHKAETWWHKASEAAKYGSFADARVKYDNAYSVLKYNGDFLFNYGAEASVAANYSLAIELLEEAKKYNSFNNLFLFLGDSHTATSQYTLAEKNYLHAIYIAPSQVYPKYQLIQLYKKWNKPQMVKAWITKTLQYPVKVKSQVSDALLEELKEDAKNNNY